RIFTDAERDRHADLQDAATRSGDTDEKKALDEYEATLLARLKAAYAKGDIDPSARFQALTKEDVQTETTAKYLGESVFTSEEKAKYSELSAKLEMYRARLGRWNSNVVCVTQVAGPPSGPDIAPTHVLKRGDYRQPAEIVEPGFLSAITGHSEPAAIETDRYRQFPTRGWRMTLAKWIARPDNPLTARVMVNRIWQYHFGRGLVGTPSNFGKNGERPTHPELLDWLANTFIERGW